MTLEQLGNIGEFVAAIGVLLSLLFVGYQFLQHTAELRQSSFRDVFQAYSGNRRAIYTDPELAALIISAKGRAPEELSEEERFRLENYYSEQLWITVQLWGVRRTGGLQFSADSWRTTLDVLLNDMDSRIFRHYWARCQLMFPEPFTEEFNELLKTKTRE